MRRVLLSTALSLSLPAAGFAASGAMPAANPMPVKNAAAPAAKWVMAAFIGDLTGSAQMQLPGSDVWMMTKVGQRIPVGSVIKTGPDSTVVLGFTDGSKASLSANTVFRMTTVADDKLEMFVGIGKLTAWVAKLKGRAFRIRTPVSVASVRGSIVESRVEFSGDLAAGMRNALNLASMLPDEIARNPSIIGAFSAQNTCHQGGLAVSDNRGNTQNLGAGQTVSGNASTGNSQPTQTSASVPVEPNVTVPENLASATPPASAPETTGGEAPSEVPAGSEESAPKQETSTVNNPLQETTTASPSAP